MIDLLREGLSIQWYEFAAYGQATVRVSVMLQKF
jgi:hypothetical protein